MRILHFSDPHITSPITFPSAFFDKRFFGSLNYYFTRRGKYPLENLEKAVNKILDLEPEVVVCTGDIVATSEPEEFKKVLKILSPVLNNKNIHFLYVPGNHDIYVNNKDCMKSFKHAFWKLNNEKFSLDDLPLIQKIHNISFFIANESRALNPILSCGYIDKKTKVLLSKFFSSKKNAYEKRIFLGHFPVRNKGKQHLSWRRKLYGGEIITQALENNDLDILLCGHIHSNYINKYGESMEICTGSITLSGILNILEIRPSSNKVKQYWEYIDTQRDSTLLNTPIPLEATF